MPLKQCPNCKYSYKADGGEISKSQPLPKPSPTPQPPYWPTYESVKQKLMENALPGFGYAKGGKVAKEGCPHCKFSLNRWRR